MIAGVAGAHEFVTITRVGLSGTHRRACRSPVHSLYRSAQCQHASTAIVRTVSSRSAMALRVHKQLMSTSPTLKDVRRPTTTHVNTTVSAQSSKLKPKRPDRFPELARLPKLEDIGSVPLSAHHNVGRGSSIHRLHGNAARSGPVYAGPFFSMHMFPPSLLEPLKASFLTVKLLPSIPPFGLLDPVRNSVTFIFATSKKVDHTRKAIHPKPTVRNRIVGRIKASIRMVVERGMQVKRTTAIVKGEEVECDEIVSETGDMGLNKWILSDWAYIVYPTLEAYSAPMSSLIIEARSALSSLKTRAEQLALQFSASEVQRDANDRRLETRVVDKWVQELADDLHRSPYFWAVKMGALDSPSQKKTPAIHRVKRQTAGSSVHVKNEMASQTLDLDSEFDPQPVIPTVDVVAKKAKANTVSKKKADSKASQLEPDREAYKASIMDAFHVGNDMASQTLDSVSVSQPQPLVPTVDSVAKKSKASMATQKNASSKTRQPDQDKDARKSSIMDAFSSSETRGADRQTAGSPVHVKNETARHTLDFDSDFDPEMLFPTVDSVTKKSKANTVTQSNANSKTRQPDPDRDAYKASIMEAFHVKNGMASQTLDSDSDLDPHPLISSVDSAEKKSQADTGTQKKASSKTRPPDPDKDAYKASIMDAFRA